MENLLLEALPLTLQNLGDNRTPELIITYGDERTCTIRKSPYHEDQCVYTDNLEPNDREGDVEQIAPFIMDQADIHYGILKIQYDEELNDGTLDNIQIIYNIRANISRAKTKIRMIPKLLSLHKRAISTANHPDRLQKAGAFDDPDKFDERQYPQKRPRTEFGKIRININSINKMIRYVSSL
jgi:hypothetical protein